jgi:hypothetical protein
MRTWEELSVFDSYVVSDGGRFYFTGESTKALYGGPLPLTSVEPTHRAVSQNIYHYGNPEDVRPDIVNGLLYGIEFTYGRRYVITPLDLAIMKDIGLQTVR